jgi:hypothetical protein
VSGWGRTGGQFRLSSLGKQAKLGKQARPCFRVSRVISHSASYNHFSISCCLFGLELLDSKSSKNRSGSPNKRGLGRGSWIGLTGGMTEYSLVMSEKVPFDKRDYPGYNQKRGDGQSAIDRSCLGS